MKGKLQFIFLIMVSIFLFSCSQNNADISNDHVTNNNDEVVNNNELNDHVNKDDENNQVENDEEDNEVALWRQAYEAADDDITVLVNKEVELEEDDHPEDLVTVDVPTVLDNPEVKQMREEAAQALKEMFEAAKADRLKLYARSGFRSYQTQVQLFNNYVSQHGEAEANRYSARPGQSEHQTGLTMDVTAESANLDLTRDFNETEEGKWLANHAHQYGFIIRYPEGKEEITGYIYEPWHIRYLSVDLATAVYNSGLTYEEFLDIINEEH